MDNSSKVEQLLTEIRDLLRSTDQRNIRLARVTYSFMTGAIVLSAILLAACGYLFWLILVAAPPP